jgi:hypothetical protein
MATAKERFIKFYSSLIKEQKAIKGSAIQTQLAKSKRRDKRKRREKRHGSEIRKASARKKATKVQAFTNPQPQKRALARQIEEMRYTGPKASTALEAGPLATRQEKMDIRHHKGLESSEKMGREFLDRQKIAKKMSEKLTVKDPEGKSVKLRNLPIEKRRTRYLEMAHKAEAGRARSEARSAEVRKRTEGFKQAREALKRRTPKARKLMQAKGAVKSLKPGKLMGVSGAAASAVGTGVAAHKAAGEGGSWSTRFLKFAEEAAGLPKGSTGRKLTEKEKKRAGTL